MRFLLLLLLVCGSSLPSGTVPDCNWKMPELTASCTQTIKWKAHNDDQATATCLEYFPTTFLEGTANADTITCTVSRQFECRHVPGSVVIFDKCYTFDARETELKTVPEYLASRATMCPGEGGLPVLLTMTQAKHVAKEAHKKGIFKMWANLDKDGKTIDKTYSLGGKEGTEPEFLLYRNMWKVHDASYWDGEKLKKSPKKGDEYDPPTTAKYLFFRTNTDYVNNMWQGSFERATDTVKAHVVCEYQAKVVPDQEKYCGKLQKLGLNAKYDSHRNKRCVFKTLAKYPLEGTEVAVKGFTGCNEKPSDMHSSGLDDGTAGAVVYSELTSAGTYRVAAIRMESSYSDTASFRDYCESGRERERHRRPYTIYSHFMKDEFSQMITIVWDDREDPVKNRMTVDWEDEYPKNECTDFPNDRKMYSNALAIRKGRIIDVPTPVRFPALCSIVTNIDCKLYEDKANNKNVCGGDGPARYDMKCEDVEEWNLATKHYAKCSCLVHHQGNGNQCDWSRSNNECGAVRGMRNGQDLGWLGMLKNSHDTYPTNNWGTNVQLVVRKGCTVWIYGGQSNNVALLENLTVGEYDLPHQHLGHAHTTSAYRCTCP